MKIGMLTGGGDCPGLNPAIRGAVLRLLDYGDEIIGFSQGWKGLVEGNTEPLNLERVEGIISLGGTILRSSRTNPFAARLCDRDRRCQPCNQSPGLRFA